MKISFSLNLPDWVSYFDMVLDLFFIIDIIFNFSTGSYDKGLLTMQRKFIVK